MAAGELNILVHWIMMIFSAFSSRRYCAVTYTSLKSLSELQQALAPCDCMKFIYQYFKR